MGEITERCMRDFTDESKKKYIPSKKESDSIKSNVKHGGKGKPLEPGLKSIMRSSFGPNVDDVRIHTDSRTEETVHEQGAQAFTMGKDIYFAEGKYHPSTQEGRRLLAHELTHIVQQKENQKKQAGDNISGNCGDNRGWYLLCGVRGW